VRAAAYSRSSAAKAGVRAVIEALEAQSIDVRPEMERQPAGTPALQPTVWAGDVMRFRGRTFDHLFAIRMQEDVGLQVITDGEFRRVAWSMGFVSALEGFEQRLSMPFHAWYVRVPPPAACP